MEFGAPIDDGLSMDKPTKQTQPQPTTADYPNPFMGAWTSSNVMGMGMGGDGGSGGEGSGGGGGGGGGKGGGRGGGESSPDGEFLLTTNPMRQNAPGTHPPLTSFISLLSLNSLY